MTVVEILSSDPRADLAMLTGTWQNTNAQSGEIVRIEITADDREVWLDPDHRGRIPIAVYYERNDEGLEQPFTGEHDFGFKEVALYGFLRQGLLVLLTFNRFKDGSARSNYFMKEFFHRLV